MLTRRFVSPGIMLSMVILLAAFLAACGGNDATPTPTQAPEPPQANEGAGTGSTDDSGAAMEKEDGDAMTEKEDGDAMTEKEDGDAMTEKEDADAMMEKEDGDAMMDKEDGDAMMEKEDGDAMMEKEDGDAMMEKEDGDAMMDKEDGDAMMEKLPDKITAPHFVSSSPNHGDTLAQLPDALVLNFNFSLHSDSSIAISKDGEPVSLGTVTISDDTLSLTVQILNGSADGTYQANYRACWPDQSCHEGSIAFIVKQTT